MVTTENYDTNKNCGTNISRTKIAINSKFGEVTSYVLKYGLSRQNFISQKNTVFMEIMAKQQILKNCLLNP